MSELISKSKSRKQYDCMAWDWISNTDFYPGDLRFGEIRSILKAKQIKGKILKGETYTKKALKDDDSVYTFRAIPELDDICIRLELYGD